jgi:hypothetical protein
MQPDRRSAACVALGCLLIQGAIEYAAPTRTLSLWGGWCGGGVEAAAYMLQEVPVDGANGFQAVAAGTTGEHNPSQRRGSALLCRDGDDTGPGHLTRARQGLTTRGPTTAVKTGSGGGGSSSEPARRLGMLVK